MNSLFQFPKEPLENFQVLFAEAQSKIAKDVNAVSLATVGTDGMPRARIVLYKGLVRDGFSFYTNYQSQKGVDLTGSPRASLLFFWSALDWQIRIEGIVKSLTEQESDQYFASRPRLSQIGAWASQQSRKISGMAELEKAVTVLEEKYQGQEVPRPPHWGGYHVLPLRMEFWFGRTGRLHERYTYERVDLKSPWQRFMQAP